MKELDTIIMKSKQKEIMIEKLNFEFWLKLGEIGAITILTYVLVILNVIEIKRSFNLPFDFSLVFVIMSGLSGIFLSCCCIKAYHSIECIKRRK